MTHGKYAYADGTDSQTDGRTPDRYITLSARRGECLTYRVSVANEQMAGKFYVLRAGFSAAN